MKKLSVELTDEQYEKFVKVADHYKNLGLPISVEKAFEWSCGPVLNKSQTSIITSVNAAIKSLTAAPQKTKVKKKTEE